MSKVKRILIGVGIVVALIAIWYIIAVFWQGSTKPILAVADKFRPDQSWIMKKETIRPPKIVCESVDIVCPEVTRYWESKDDKGLSYEQFADLLKSAGWNFTIHGRNCEPDQGNEAPLVYLCEASGTIGGFYIDATYIKGIGDEKPHIDLYVKKG